MQKISQLLKEEREKRDLSIEHVERITKIRKNFLLAIENGKFDQLPSQAYAMGFVKNYASFLGYPEGKAIALFRREYDDKKENSVTFKQRESVRKGFFDAKRILLFATFIIIIIFIIFQYGSLIFGPKLEVVSPRDRSIIGGNLIEVKGKTDPYAALFINEEEVYVAPFDGSFKKTIYTFSGEQKIKIVAKNRYGKSSKKELSVTVK